MHVNILQSPMVEQITDVCLDSLLELERSVGLSCESCRVTEVKWGYIQKISKPKTGSIYHWPAWMSVLIHLSCKRSCAHYFTIDDDG